MLTVTAEPKSIEELHSTIMSWFGKRLEGLEPPCTISRSKRDLGIDVFVSHSASDFKVELSERFLLFQLKATKLNLNLEKFSIRSAFQSERLCLNINEDPEWNRRVLLTVFRQLNETKHPAFFARILRAAKSLEDDLSAALIEEATSAATDQLVMLEALSSAPWVAELAAADPLLAAKLRGLELRQQMLKAAGGPLSSLRVAEVLRISRQAVDKRRAANQLLALTQGKRGYTYPGFQFENGKAINGLEEVLFELRALDPWMQLRFFTSTNERLHQQSAIEALGNGKLQEVIQAASGYGEQGAQ